MKKYNNFKEYMEDVYYDEIFNRVKGLVYARKDSFESDTVYSVSYAEPYVIHVSGVTFKEPDDGLLMNLMWKSLWHHLLRTIHIQAVGA